MYHNIPSGSNGRRPTMVTVYPQFAEIEVMVVMTEVVKWGCKEFTALMPGTITKLPGLSRKIVISIKNGKCHICANDIFPFI